MCFNRGIQLFHTNNNCLNYKGDSSYLKQHTFRGLLEFLPQQIMIGL